MDSVSRILCRWFQGQVRTLSLTVYQGPVALVSKKKWLQKRSEGCVCDIWASGRLSLSRAVAQPWPVFSACTQSPQAHQINEHYFISATVQNFRKYLHTNPIFWTSRTNESKWRKWIIWTINNIKTWTGQVLNQYTHSKLGQGMCWGFRCLLGSWVWSLALNK